jgi:hypothetical protein
MANLEEILQQLGKNNTLTGIYFPSLASLASGSTAQLQFDTHGNLKTTVNLEADIALGAVELKNGASDQRAYVDAGGQLAVNISSLATLPSQMSALTTLTTQLAALATYTGAIKTSLWTSGWLSASGTFTIVKSTAGTLRMMSVDMKSSPSLTIYDDPSGPSGTMIATVNENAPMGNYLYDLPMTNGIVVYTSVGVAPSIRITYK